VALEDSGNLLEFRARVRDISEAGLGLETSRRVRTGTPVQLSGELITDNGKKRFERATGHVVSCNSVRIGLFATGIILDEAAKPSADSSSEENEELADPIQDHYEVLQVNPSAEPDTIHRIYRILAQRYHPDNQNTGDQKRFMALLEAYKVLSDPERRAAFDVAREGNARKRWKIFDSPDAMLGREAEKRKREAILSLLYRARVNDYEQAAITILDLERLLGCPREHLEFSLWYLKESGYILFGDNGRYSITIKGVDQAEQLPVLPDSRLLNAAGQPG